MKLDHALATLKDAEVYLRTKGVLHAGVFGSVARGDADQDSDLDILVDFDPDAHVGVNEYVGVWNDIADLFTIKVDVIDSSGLKPALRENVSRDVIYAMRSERERYAIEDILENISLAIEFVGHRSADELKKDSLSLRDGPRA